MAHRPHAWRRPRGRPAASATNAFPATRHQGTGRPGRDTSQRQWPGPAIGTATVECFASATGKTHTPRHRCRNVGCTVEDVEAWSIQMKLLFACALRWRRQRRSRGTFTATGTSKTATPCRSVSSSESPQAAVPPPAPPVQDRTATAHLLRHTGRLRHFLARDRRFIGHWRSWLPS